MTTLQQQHLDKIAHQIRQRYADAQPMIHDARERTMQAIAEALLCGAALSQAHEIVGAEQWKAWLGLHCHGVQTDKAALWMWLAANASQAEPARMAGVLGIV